MAERFASVFEDELCEKCIIAFSRYERTHPNLVSQASQAREIEIFCGLQIGHPSRFLQELWASFSFISTAI